MEYRGKGITVTYDATVCTHATECVRGLPDVFDIRSRPWIQPGNADPEQIAEVIRRCPSGALQYRLTGTATEPS